MNERIYGYETEFALIISDDKGDSGKVRRLRIYDALERLISLRLKVLPGAYRKKGIFMQNGGLFNYEALHSRFLDGLVEMATPECRTAREAARYHEAQTELLRDMIKKVNDDPGGLGTSGEQLSLDESKFSFGPLLMAAFVIVLFHMLFTGLSWMHLFALPALMMLIILDMLRMFTPLKEDSSGPFQGKIIIGKSNRDASGKYISSHENYLVEDNMPFAGRFVILLAAPLFYAAYGILTLVSYIPLIIMFLITAGFSFGSGLLVSFFSGLKGMEEKGEKLADFAQKILGSEECFTSYFVKVQGDFSYILFYPLVQLYSLVISPFVFHRYQQDLVPFLCTRTLFSGSGKITLPEVKEIPSKESGEYRSLFQISQRAMAMKAVARIFFDDEIRPLIDLRDCFLEPLSAFRRKKRMHLLFSDTNMSSIGVYLKLGITGLIIEMIEDGVTFEEVRLRDPLDALKVVACDTSLREKLELVSGEKATALEIQRKYLARAKEHFSGPALQNDALRDLLEKWEYVLSCLEINPHLLYKKIDWVTKKDLIEEICRGRGTLGEIGEIAHWIAWITLKCPDKWPGELYTLELLENALDEKSFSEFRGFLELNELSYEEFVKRWRLYYEVAKADFKFHQLDDEGYYYQLARSELVEGLFTPEEIAWATIDPPLDTRALIRGELIKRYGMHFDAENPEAFRLKDLSKVKIGWNVFCTLWPLTFLPSRTLSFNDPFQNDFIELEKKLEQMESLMENPPSSISSGGDYPFIDS
ncbi:MAG: proteasome accessory factor PafA2 family protein [Candidatus Eremiobacteraeota bacterium]|nr:proteasome accessory factor PafA2 family protein [Candidatus Eremiobacteraeota bacterium]